MIFQFEIVEHLTNEVYGLVGDKCLTIAGLSRNIVSSVSATQILLRMNGLENILAVKKENESR